MILNQNRHFQKPHLKANPQAQQTWRNKAVVIDKFQKI